MSSSQNQVQPLNYKWIVMGIVMAGTLMASLDSSIVNVSIPAIMADFGASVDEIEWVITGYMIAFATLMPLTTWFRNIIGYRKLYIISVIVFTAGSLLCGLAWNLPSLIVARVIQALGGGAITPTGMAMITEVFAPHERGKAMGIWGMGVIMGPAVGPTIGGYLTNHFGWRSIFLVNLPIGVAVVIAAAILLLRDVPHRNMRKPFDFWGFGFLTVFLVALLLGLTKGESEGWTSSYILTCSAISMLGLLCFLLVESTVEHGVVKLSLFRIPVFSACAMVMLVRSVVLFGGIFLLPLFMQQQMRYEEIQSGLILLPGSLLMAFVMPFGGRISDKIGPRIPTLIGLVGLWIFMYMYRNMDVNMSAMDLINPTLVRGVGMGLLMAPITAAGMNAVAQRDAGMASSMFNIIQQVGGSIGISLLSTVLSHRIPFHLAGVGSSLDRTSPVFMESFQNLSHHIHSLGYTYAQSAQIAQGVIFQKVSQYAVVLSFQDAFLAGSALVVVAFVAAFFLPGKSAVSAEEEKVTAEMVEEIVCIE
ncbi:MAG TPA: DHA2 family efflux MFS transporter permease subunit [Spirochaetota bacterium]|nr:DHA2 family efflux MFS transporter permease subunit [Spirochaetota bacterium]HPS87519.1 DHA2 family efflux MFS transporter permease subunit [Spirochaetota bacterium]